VKCDRCGGTGWIEYVGGTHLVGRVQAVATPEKPIYARCRHQDADPADLEAWRAARRPVDGDA
jgi:hypothetical protein